MRRALVLTDESARHPFLASLPPHIRRDTVPVPSRPAWHLTGADMRHFAMAYCACLLAVTVFIY